MVETTYNLASIEGHNMERVFNSGNSSSEIEPEKILDSLKLNFHKSHYIYISVYPIYH